MSRKTSQLQIRVSPEQKTALKRMAAEAGLNVSEFVLATVLPSSQAEFAARAKEIADRSRRPAALRELQDYLSGLAPDELKAAVSHIDMVELAPALQNYVAATVEQITREKGVPAPGWATAIPGLATPHFAWEPRSLRPHLMRITPGDFKRRNVFVDAAGVETSAGRPIR